MQIIHLTPTSLDYDVFLNVDVASATKSFAIQTNDFTKAASYVLRLTAYYSDYPAN